MTAQEAANLRSARNIAIARAGLSISVDETKNLSYDDAAKYRKELASVILTYPARFSEETVAAARGVIAANYQPLENYTASDAVSDFVAEAANQAQAINPLSEQNRGTTAKFLMLATVAAVLGFAAYFSFSLKPRRS